MALGMVTQLPEEADEHSVTMRQLLAKLDVAMGGRVAEELIFGASDVTTGASSDLEQVTFASLSLGLSYLSRASHKSTADQSKFCAAPCVNL